jgi:hypothetical protein
MTAVGQTDVGGPQTGAPGPQELAELVLFSHAPIVALAARMTMGR